MKPATKTTIAAFIILALTTGAQAQSVTAAPGYLPPDAPASSQPPAASYSEPQLDQMMAPIALYPDPLIGQVLMASTYPLEVVEAARWQQSNPGLQGDQLAAAVDQQPWDPSVKSLTAFPDVLKMMNTNIQWTEQVGDAFLAQQPAVMDSVQRLRGQAMEAGTLRSNQQELVSDQGSEISIEPANPGVVYVPAYNPAVVYGSWDYPSYPPYDFYPAGYGFGGALIGFGAGVYVVNSLWGWDRWDWRHHRMDIDDRRFAGLNRGHASVSGGVWQHDPAHRAGVPYRDAGTRGRYQAGNVDARRGYRGYAATPQAHGAAPAFHSNAAAPAFHGNVERTPHNVEAPRAEHAAPAAMARPAPAAVPARQFAPAMQQRQEPVVQRPAPMQRPATPAFESFSRGNDVRAQSARGAMSRAAPPAQQQQAPVANFSRGNGGGNGGGGDRSNNNRHR